MVFKSAINPAINPVSRSLIFSIQSCAFLLSSLLFFNVGAFAADLSGLKPYDPEQRVSGTIRNYGNGFAGVLKKWEEGFRKFHPGIKFDDNLPTSDAAFPALITGVTDLAPNGSEPALTETLGFYEVYGYHATPIAVANGTYDVEGHSPGVVIFTHKDNPINGLTMQQLDGIFGAERDGGMRGFKWTLEDGRSESENIRTWGQLGLMGKWANKPISTYGHAPSGTSRFFQLQVLKNGDKWNPNYKEYVETGSKMISDTDRARQLGGARHMLGEELANNPYGIAWSVTPQSKGISGIKPIALSKGIGQPYVMPNSSSFQDRSYPLVRSIYIYLNRKPGVEVDPKFKEFLRFILSKEGQEIVQKDGGFLPLPVHYAEEQLSKLY